MLRHAKPGRRALQQFDVSDLPNRCRQIQPDDFFLLATPEASHQQNSRRDSFFAQRYRLIQRGHAQPGCAFFLKNSCALHRAMAISVGLHHRANRHSAANVFRNRAVVLAQCGKRNFRPRRPRRRSFRNVNSRHCRIIIRRSGPSKLRSGSMPTGLT